MGYGKFSNRVHVSISLVVLPHLHRPHMRHSAPFAHSSPAGARMPLPSPVHAGWLVFLLSTFCLLVLWCFTSIFLLPGVRCSLSDAMCVIFSLNSVSSLYGFVLCSPEIIHGKAYDGKTRDMWSLGTVPSMCTLCMCVCECRAPGTAKLSAFPCIPVCTQHDVLSI